MKRTSSTDTLSPTLSREGTAMSSPSESSSALSAVDRLDLSSRATPPLGGLSLTLLSLEARRRLRNRRAMIFSVLLPVAFFLMFTTTDYSSTPYGNGNVVANMMIGMALYGALMTTTGAGGTAHADAPALGVEALSLVRAMKASSRPRLVISRSLAR